MTVPRGRVETVAHHDDDSVGARLRAFRRGRGLTLKDVEERSGAEFRQSVLGAYERGARTMSLPRLARLATVYGVTVDDLLGAPKSVAEAKAPAGLVVDLSALSAARGRDADAVRRYVTSLLRLRQGPQPAVIVLRGEDARTIMRLLGPGDNTEARLAVLGLRPKGRPEAARRSGPCHG